MNSSTMTILLGAVFLDQIVFCGQAQTTAAKIDRPTNEIGMAKAFLRSVGVFGPYRLLSQNVPDPMRKFPGVVELNAGNHSPYAVYFRPESDTIYGVDRKRKVQFKGDYGAFSVDLPRHDVHNRALESKLRAWVAPLVGKEELNFDGIQADKKNVAEARFSVLKNGHPFILGYDWFGYSFKLTVPDGQFLSMSRNVGIPAVDPRPAKLSKVDAIKVFDATFKAKIAVKARLEHHWTVTYTLMPATAFGFYKLPAEVRAHLVWVISYRIDGEIAEGKYSPFRSMMINAVTGAVEMGL